MSNRQQRQKRNKGWPLGRAVKALPPSPPTPEMKEAQIQQALWSVENTHKTIRKAERDLVKWVGRARQKGATWAQISEVVGLSLAGAQRKFASAEAEAEPESLPRMKHPCCGHWSRQHDSLGCEFPSCQCDMADWQVKALERD